MLGRALVLALAIAAHGRGARAFVCNDSVECNDGGIAGVCEPGNDLGSRMRARVVGTDPVVVDGWFEVEQNGGWNVLAATTLVHEGPMRIVDPGVVAFSAHVQLEHFADDDFAYDVASP